MIKYGGATTSKGCFAGEPSRWSMCPCDVAAKKMGHMGHIGHMGGSPMGQRDSHAVLHMLRVSGPSACLGTNLRSKVFHCAKLRDGTRDCVLALKITRSPFSSFSWFNSFTLAVLFEYFEYFVVKCLCHPSVFRGLNDDNFIKGRF